MKPSLQLDDGTYTVVAVAHAGIDHATISKTQRIAFHKNKVTDTYMYNGEITVSGNNTLTLPMTRVTAKVSIVCNNSSPQDVTTNRV